jgi:hypothetical protein
MTDIEICQRDMLYPLSVPRSGVTRFDRLSRVLAKDDAMTTQIIHLTAKIQHWLNQSVARHLAAQAERLEPATKH